MNPFYQDHLLTVYQSDVMDGLGELPDCSVHCCVTSPPYWGLRDYGVAGQIGLEKTPEEYFAKMVAVFREVKRVLRDDGTLWLNLGDSYCGSTSETPSERANSPIAVGTVAAQEMRNGRGDRTRAMLEIGLKPKDLVGIPWRVAFALQADGWYLRSDIIWHKPNPMPESVTDRPTKAHEYIFLLSKNARYYYDAEAVKETAQYGYSETSDMYGQIRESSPTDDRGMQKRLCQEGNGGTRNKRTVWTVPSQPYPESHFATFPEDLIKPCILAGTSAKGCCPKCGAPWIRVVEKEQVSGGTEERKANGHPSRYGDTKNKACSTEDGTWSMPHFETRSKTIDWQPGCECGHGTLQPCTVLDPFGGSFTTAQVALELGRKSVIIEINPKYVKLGMERTHITPSLPLA